MNADSGSVRVVIAEDNEMLRETLGLALKEAGYQVVGAAADGVTAVETVLREEPDVTVMDIRMPGIDGIEATRRIREANGSRTVILMLTAFDEPTLMQSALDAGAAGFLVKGIPLARLVDEIQHAHVLRRWDPAGTSTPSPACPSPRMIRRCFERSSYCSPLEYSRRRSPQPRTLASHLARTERPCSLSRRS